MQDERSLVLRAQQGDGDAFAQIYEDYFNRIYRYVVLKIGNRTEAEDLTQQVFLKVIESISSFKWKGVPFSAWIYRIAHNLIVDYFRKENKIQKVSLDPAMVEDETNPSEEAERRMSIAELVSATKQLTEAQREVISLRFAGELSIAEVARAMGKSEGAVKALQHSAVIALRKLMMAGEDK